MAIIPGHSKRQRWFLRNEDTGQILESQYPADSVTLDIVNKWAKHTALNRTKAIHQFLIGENDKIVVRGRFYQRHALEDINRNLITLQSFARRSPETMRPPIVTFWVGNGFLERTCIIHSISGIRFHEPTVLGDLRHVEFTINLEEYQEFDLDSTEIFETRYHRARNRDYYELLAYREYKTPILGEALRKRHPTQPSLAPGAVVKLPSAEGIRRDKIEPTSIALRTSFGRKDTPQRALRIAVLAARSASHTSHIVR